MNNATHTEARRAIKRADYEKTHNSAAWMPVFADVVLDGEKVGHLSSDGYLNQTWTFHPTPGSKRMYKRKLALEEVLPKWASEAEVGPFKTFRELSDEIDAAKPKPPSVYDAIEDDSFPGNPIPFANGLADHVREHGTDSIRSDEAKRILWILIGQAYGQVAKIDLVDEWNRLTKRGGTQS